MYVCMYVYYQPLPFQKENIGSGLLAWKISRTWFITFCSTRKLLSNTALAG